MKIDASLALIPVQFIRRPVINIEQKEIKHFRRNLNRHGRLILTGNSRNTFDGAYGPYGKESLAPTIKGRMIDTYI